MNTPPKHPADDAAVLIEDRGDVRILTLNAPSRRNALDLAARLALLRELRLGEAQARVLIITGAGGFFSAGGDIRSMSDDPVESGQRLDALAALAQQLVHSRVPVIAAVEGGAFGMGLAIASAATHVVSGRGARYEASFVKIGLAPDTGLSWTLPRRIGPTRARHMMLTLTSLAGQPALDAGLVDELVDDGQALERALEVAAELARMPAAAVAGILSLSSHVAATIEAATGAESRLQAVLLASEESKALRAAFLSR